MAINITRDFCDILSLVWFGLKRDLKDKLKAKYIKDTQAHIYASINQRDNFDRLNEEMTSINVPTISAESSRIADLPSRTALDTIVAAVNQKATSTLTEPKNNFKRFAFWIDRNIAYFEEVK